MTGPVKLSDLMREADLLAAVRQLARLRGYLVYHTHDSRRSEAGFPDLVLVHPGTGKFLIRELKTAKGQLTEDQKEWVLALRAAGVNAGVWRPSDLTNGRIEIDLRPLREAS